MLKLKYYIPLNLLEKYGFKKGKDLPNYKEFISNDGEQEDYWLVSMSKDKSEVNIVEDCSLPEWSIHIMKDRKLWIEAVPDCTYHIDSLDMEEIFRALHQMITDGILEDVDRENTKQSNTGINTENLHE